MSSGHLDTQLDDGATTHCKYMGEGVLETAEALPAVWVSAERFDKGQ